MLCYIFCNGSRGDCEPGICLANKLIKNNNNKVIIFGNSYNEYLLKKTDIPYKIIIKNYIKKQPEKVTIFQYYCEFKNSIIQQIDEINKIQEIPDIIFGMGHQLGKFLAEKFNKPYYHIILQYSQVNQSIRKKNLICYYLEMFNKILMILISIYELIYFNKIRNKYKLNYISDFNDYIYNNDKQIIANSLILNNYNYIHHDKIFISGNWNLSENNLDSSIDAIDGLYDFLVDSNKIPYIYLNLGSWSQNINSELYKLYESAFKRINCKVIINCNIKIKSKNKQFFHCSSINQHELFPKMKTVIHCGGLGVAFKAAYYAIPQIIIPKNMDEPFWAKKIKELGIGDSIDHFNNLTSDNLFNMVNNVLKNEFIHNNASIVSKSIDINGVENTINKVFKYQKQY